MKMLCFLILIAVICTLFTSNTIAQPQAPIEWQPVRLLMDAPDSLDVNTVYAKGDTIVLVATRPVDATHLYAAVSISCNNGQTWSPWHVFYRTTGSGHYTTAAFTHQGILICTESQDYNRGFYRTTDCGLTWINPIPLYPYLEIHTTKADTVFCSTTNSGSGRITWTTDGGRSFAPLRYLGLTGFDIDDLAVSNSSFAVIDVRVWGAYPYHDLYYTSSPRDGYPFPEPYRMNPQYMQTDYAEIEMDPDGFGAVISLIRYTSLFPGYGAVVLNHTRDHGVTWSIPDTLCETETAYYSFLACRDHVWATTWMDTITSPPYSHWGIWCAVSANRGRSWYPSRQCFESDVWAGDFRKLDFRANIIRLYGSFREWNGMQGDYFLQWEGIIHPDTIPPAITDADSLPPMIAPDTTIIIFTAQAQDNDSLWKMEVILKQVEQEDSLILPLVLDGNDTCRAMWTVPYDTGTWTYYYRAEDMWENVSFYPLEGPASPWTFHIGPLSASDDFILHPSSFILSVYPNPFNSTAQIHFTLPITQRMSLKLYDVLGREVAVLLNEMKAAGEHRVRFDGSALASGVYFCRMEAGKEMRTQKIVLMK